MGQGDKTTTKTFKVDWFGGIYTDILPPSLRPWFAQVEYNWNDWKRCHWIPLCCSSPHNAI